MKAYEVGKKFKVIIVDSSPKYEGKTTLFNLLSNGIECTYVLLSGLSYIMNEVSKVFLGAHALLSNGSFISRVGTAIVAMMAHSTNVPVLVACETYKFHERVQLDSICYNELDDPNVLINDSEVSKEDLSNWEETPNLKLLNICYDVTPMDYVNVVITEVGLIPPTSVPVVLREAAQLKLTEGSELDI